VINLIASGELVESMVVANTVMQPQVMCMMVSGSPTSDMVVASSHGRVPRGMMGSGSTGIVLDVVFSTFLVETAMMESGVLAK